MLAPPPLEETIDHQLTDGDLQQPPPPQSYLLHSINSTIAIRQLPSQGISFQLWPAAAALVALLDRQTQSTSLSCLTTTNSRRLRILELGSGTGLVGIAAAALLGASVTVTDLPHVLPNLQFNVNGNAGIVEPRGGEVRVAAVSWGDVQQMEGVGREFDVILGSDVVYHDHLYEPLLQTLKFFLTRGEREEREVVFVMAHLKRWKKESAFFKRANKFFDVEIIHRDSPSNGARVGVNFYKFVTRAALKLNSVLSK
ncbi:putative methyltransferase family protein [Perilla frutescens var. hirtella]|uniref:Methyltransferase family protein n=1 Tax=Perilla frutescens var. hirtella TaxID=608512 RepID=A0AAD4P5R6_PERFH|nr:putative methyltransferase family protein [Perilla frutescens var. hirtella]